MKRIVMALLGGILFLTACGQSIPVTQAAPIPVIDNATATPSPIPTTTQTLLPIIPTFTPTFDVSTILTATPASKAECPKADHTISFDNGFKKIDACMKSVTANKDSSDCLNKNLHNEILDYLNSGGDINTIISQLDAGGFEKNYLYVYTDLTGDSEPEFLLRDTFRHSFTGGYFFYSCANGHYTIKLDTSQEDGLEIYSIQDINLNGIPEMVFLIRNALVVIEWNGDSFVETLGIRDFGESRYKIQDTNHDGLMEIILSRGYPPLENESDELPWRHYVSTYAWNGSSYVLKSKEFEYPYYRFQAIQDADRYARAGINEKAFSYYQDAIFNKDLEWWSPERRESLFIFLRNSNTPSPSQMELSPDLAEYPRLAAYAYFRIMLLHIAQGQESNANTTYNTLQENFSNDPYGHPYVEMATGFWDAYQSTNSMYNGCAATIQYAAEHPEILIPLGSDYHGSQSHRYKPEDVCPFR